MFIHGQIRTWIVRNSVGSQVTSFVSKVTSSRYVEYLYQRIQEHWELSIN